MNYAQEYCVDAWLALNIKR